MKELAPLPVRKRVMLIITSVSVIIGERENMCKLTKMWKAVLGLFLMIVDSRLHPLELFPLSYVEDTRHCDVKAHSVTFHLRQWWSRCGNQGPPESH